MYKKELFIENQITRSKKASEEHQSTTSPRLLGRDLNRECKKEYVFF